VSSEPKRSRTTKRSDSPEGAPTPAKPFDAWLHKQLHAMYDEIAQEPLPSDLLDLIDADAKKAAGAGPEQPSGTTKPKPA
jgi:hypothetical protein